jgi:hypothetical protein
LGNICNFNSRLEKRSSLNTAKASFAVEDLQQGLLAVLKFCLFLLGTCRRAHAITDSAIFDLKILKSRTPNIDLFFNIFNFPFLNQKQCFFSKILVLH